MLPSMVQVLRHWVPPTERYHFMWAYCGKSSHYEIFQCSFFLYFMTVSLVTHNFNFYQALQQERVPLSLFVPPCNIILGGS